MKKQLHVLLFTFMVTTLVCSCENDDVHYKSDVAGDISVTRGILTFKVSNLIKLC